MTDYAITLIRIDERGKDGRPRRWCQVARQDFSSPHDPTEHEFAAEEFVVRLSGAVFQLVAKMKKAFA